MNRRMPLKTVAAALLAGLLAACASSPQATLQRPGNTPHLAGRPDPAVVTTQALEEAQAADARAQIRRGTGNSINNSVAGSSPPNLVGTTGDATFNFEGVSLAGVVKAILGDMLGQNYVIAPGVQGTVTLATPKPVSAAAALSLLEMVLGWNNARMVYSDGRYNIVPADQALATGVVAPRTGSATSARGFEVRAVPLRFISATEMEKVLKPYARPNAIVSVDNARNLITLSGSRAELENYLRTVAIFDVDWMASMSVGVFPLRTGKAAKVVGDLEKVFGEGSKSPVAGMFRFMPLEGSNAVLAITSQPAYLDQVQDWIERIDSAGGGMQLFSYELKYITAKDLAERLAQVFGSGGNRGGQGGGSESGGASLAPGADPMSMDSSGGIGSSKFENNGGDMSDSGGGLGGSSGGSSGGLGNGSLALGARTGGNAAVSLEIDGDKVGVAAVDETNTLLVRTTGNAWRSIKGVIEQLDVMPLQVHIEAQVAEVKLSGNLSYGVEWYFNNAIPDLLGLPLVTGGTRTDSASLVPGSIAGGGLTWTLQRQNAAAVITALDEVTDVQMLQTPSVTVRNNYEATFNVGARIPINSTSINPGTGNDTVYSQVQYIDTGTILKVRPRVTRDGTVFMDIVQEISTPGPVATAVNGNVRIDTRKLKTNAIAQSGQTVILAGLIQDGTTRTGSGLPGLSRIPIIGGLFGKQSTGSDRSEVVILLTPTLIRNPQESADLTDEYTRRFRAMQPLRPVVPKTN